MGDAHDPSSARRGCCGHSFAAGCNKGTPAHRWQSEAELVQDARHARVACKARLGVSLAPWLAAVFRVRPQRAHVLDASVPHSGPTTSLAGLSCQVYAPQASRLQMPTQAQINIPA